MWLRSKSEVESLYAQADVFSLVKLCSKPGGMPIYGWERPEEAYMVAPYVLKPKDRFQLQYIVNVVERWLADDRGALCEDSLILMKDTLSPLIELNSYLHKHPQVAFIWTSDAQIAFDSMDVTQDWINPEDNLHIGLIDEDISSACRQSAKNVPSGVTAMKLITDMPNTLVHASEVKVRYLTLAITFFTLFSVFSKQASSKGPASLLREGSVTFGLRICNAASNSGLVIL